MRERRGLTDEQINTAYAFAMRRTPGSSQRPCDAIDRKFIRLFLRAAFPTPKGGDAPLDRRPSSTPTGAYDAAPAAEVAGASELISRIPAEDWVTGDDGFVMFWPDGRKGAFSARHLRTIADELDRRNAAWGTHLEREMIVEDDYSDRPNFVECESCGRKFSPEEEMLCRVNADESICGDCLVEGAMG